MQPIYYTCFFVLRHYLEDVIIGMKLISMECQSLIQNTTTDCWVNEDNSNNMIALEDSNVGCNTFPLSSLKSKLDENKKKSYNNNDGIKVTRNSLSASTPPPNNRTSPAIYSSAGNTSNSNSHTPISSNSSIIKIFTIDHLLDIMDLHAEFTNEFNRNAEMISVFLEIGSNSKLNKSSLLDSGLLFESKDNSEYMGSIGIAISNILVQWKVSRDNNNNNDMVNNTRNKENANNAMMDSNSNSRMLNNEHNYSYLNHDRIRSFLIMNKIQE